MGGFPEASTVAERLPTQHLFEYMKYEIQSHISTLRLPEARNMKQEKSVSISSLVGLIMECHSMQPVFCSSSGELEHRSRKTVVQLFAIAGIIYLLDAVLFTCPYENTAMTYSTVPPLRNCIIRYSGLISLNRVPPHKKLSRLIHVQFLLQWYVVIL